LYSLGEAWDDFKVLAGPVLKNGPLYEMYYSGNDGTNFRLGVAYSTDGLDWVKNPSNPILEVGSTGSWDELHAYFPSVIIKNHVRRIWYSGVNAGDQYFQTGYAEYYSPWSCGKDMPTARCSAAVSAINGKVYAIGGGNLSGVLTTVEEYDTATNTWSTKTPLSVQRMESGSASLKDKIYVVGGIIGGTNYANVYEYDTVGNSWAEVASLFEARTGVACCAVNGKMYAIGGSATGGVKDTVEEYDPVGDSWTTKTPMPTGRAYPAAAVVAGKIYVTGGRYSNITRDILEIYDPEKDSWTTGSPMPRVRYRHASCTINGKVYVFGGTDDQTVSFTEVDIYDPATDTWETKAPMGVGTYNVNCAVVAGKAYIVGGYDGASSDYLSDLQIYDPVVSFDLWLEQSPMSSPPPRHHHAMAYDTARGVVVLFGGYNATTSLDDTWEWDGKYWAQRFPADKPPMRLCHAMAYDSTRGVVVMFGGKDTLHKNDTWEWDGVNWMQRVPASSPPVRHGHSMTYDSARGVVVLFGGGDNGFATTKDDTWEWDGTNWAPISRSLSNEPSACAPSSPIFSSVKNSSLSRCASFSNPIAEKKFSRSGSSIFDALINISVSFWPSFRVMSARAFALFPPKEIIHRA
jgi:hypothetical protein